MRKVKKLLGLLLAAVMVLAMGVPTFAASGGYSIKINDESSEHTYVAYQVFRGTVSVSDNGQTLSNVEWGDGVNGEALLAALKGPEGTLTAYQTCTSAAEVAKVLEGYDDDSQAIKEFSDIVGQHLSETTSGTLSAYDEASKSYTISGLAAGYYFIKDADTVAETDAYTDFILKLTNDETITRKADVPSVEKKVQEDDKDITYGEEDDNYGEGYNDVADWNIGDPVPFKLIGTLPTNFADYDTYQYIFHDTLSTGLSLNQDTIHVYMASDKAGTKDKKELHGYTVNVPGTEEENQCSFEVAFADLTNSETVGEEVTANKYIIVEYTATLNKDAEIGLPGNPNRVYLEFSNNPNSGGEGDTGKTPEDKVIVFTYELDATKVDGEHTDTKLKDAEFVLYKEVDGVKQYAQVAQEDQIDQETQEITIKKGTIIGWDPAVSESENSITYPENSTLKSDENGLFKVIGLDDGTYWLKETKAPDGYNLITDPIMIVITANTENDQHWEATEEPDNALVGLHIDVTAGGKETSGTGVIDTGVVSTDVENNQGAELPETGGMGTTIFYVLGAILVLGAGGLLIARRRTDSEK